MKSNTQPKAEQRAALTQETLTEEALVDRENGPRDSVVIIPTYNEALNVELLVPSILRQGPFDILIVDDNSPDGTGALAEELARRFPGRVNVLHRASKLGLASAYLAGFDYVLAQGYQQVFTMDADFSHDPGHLPALRAALAGADVVLGSRYVSGGGTRRWPLWRRLLSRGGSAYARLLLGLPFRDLTSGFKGFRRQVLLALQPELARMKAQGYAFQIEMTYRCVQQGWRVVEVPIQFENRLVGASKMSRRIVAEALWLVWTLRLSQGAAASHPDARPRAQLARRRMVTAAMAFVFLMLFLGAVNIAPKWLSHLVQRGSVQSAALSPRRPTSSAARRSKPLPKVTRVTARAQTASLQLRGTDLTPNVPLSFVGSGFLPGEALVATIEDTQGHPETQLALLNADHTGGVSMIAQKLLPTLTPGTHILLVKGEQSQRTAQATFQLHWIPPTVELDTHSVKPKHDVGFSGGGFLPNEVVEVRLGSSVSKPVATVSANAGGNVAGRFTVPVMPEGDYRLFFVGLQSQTPTSVGLNVQGFHPWVVLDTYAPKPHARMGFEGRDFAPGEEVLVYLNERESKPVARTYADTTGRFVAQAAWEVGELSGENTLIFVGQQSGAVVTTTFTVVS